MNSRANTNSQIHTTIKGLVPPSVERGSGASGGRGSHAAPVSFSSSLSSRHSPNAKVLGERLAYSPLEAARAVGVGLTTMRALLKQGRIKSVKVANRVLVSRESLQQFVNN